MKLTPEERRTIQEASRNQLEQLFQDAAEKGICGHCGASKSNPHGICTECGRFPL